MKSYSAISASILDTRRPRILRDLYISNVWTMYLYLYIPNSFSCRHEKYSHLPGVNICSHCHKSHGTETSTIHSFYIYI